MLRLPVIALLALVRTGIARLEQRIKQAKQKGLRGYDLIDAVDVWYGNNSPDYRGPHYVLDQLGDGNGRVDLGDWLAAGLPKEHFHYFDKNSNGDLDIHEAHSWHQQRQPARTMNLSEVNDPPRGHLKPLGAWKQPLPSKGLIYEKPYPHPRVFWKKHMDGYKPALLKGAQLGWSAMSWTREVLSERFGWVDAKLEPKVEARGNDTAYAELDRYAPRHRLNLSEYLRIEEGKNMYVVSIIPQAMAWEVAHPSVLLCGSRRKILDKKTGPPYQQMRHTYPHESKFDWMTHVFEANLWVATGYTRSQFHYDKEWNVNCLLSGKKRWFFLNPFDYDGQFQWSRGKKFRKDNPLNNAWTDWIFLDPDKVDLIVQHKLRTFDYYELIQEAGDCIFIPYAMLHQVQKLDTGTQVAASWMFLPETIYDEEACQEAPLDEELPLAAMDTLYMYSGKGLIPQGYMDPLNFVQGLEGEMRQSGASHLSLQLFKRAVTQGDAILRKIPNAGKRIQKLHARLSAYADDPKKGLRLDELRKVPLRLWCKPAAEGDEEGPLPCDAGEEYEFCSDDEFKKMDDFVKDRLAKRTLHADQNPKAAAEFPPLTHRRAYKSKKRGRRQSGREEL